MVKKRAVLIGTSLLAQNTRASKEARTLLRKGYLVTFLGWDRGSEAPAVETLGAGDRLKEIQLRLKAPLGKKIIFFYPVWWCFVLFQLVKRDWDIAHAINFDSIPPAVIVGELKKKPVVYEILDGYEDTLPKRIRKVAVKIGKLFMRPSKGIILADETQVEGFGGIPNSRVVAIYDSPLDTTYNLNNIGHQKNDAFTLFYGGILGSRKVLNLDKLFTAIKSIEGIKVVIAGWGDLVEEIKEWTYKMPDKIQFIGAVSHAEILQRSAEADLLFVLRSPSALVNKYVCGSKLFEAMMCGKPLLVNKGTSTAVKVSQENCGLVVDANNIEEIRNAIIRLRDNPELCRQLGASARKAYEQKYGWHIMEQRLIGLYRELIENENE